MENIKEREREGKKKNNDYHAITATSIMISDVINSELMPIPIHEVDSNLMDYERA